MRKEINWKFRTLLEKLESAWAVNDIAVFMNTAKQIEILFSQKLQLILNDQNKKIVLDLDVGKSEEKLQKLNTMLDEVLKKNAVLEENSRLANEIKELIKDEGDNNP